MIQIEIMKYVILPAIVISFLAVWWIMKFRHTTDWDKLLSTLPKANQNMANGVILIVFHNRKVPSDPFLQIFIWVYRLAILSLVLMIIGLFNPQM